MAATPTVVISAKDVPTDEPERRALLDDVRERIEQSCRALAEEFPETTRFEIILSTDGLSYAAHAHVTGRSTEVAPQATATDLRAAADQLMDRVEKQLRRLHDKRIFTPRREAMLNNPKRGG